MQNWFKNSLKTVAVLTGIVALTSFSIDATDTFKGSQTALSIFAKKASEKTCPSDMVLVESGTERFCLDRYEDSIGINCVVDQLSNVEDTAKNINTPKCAPQSIAQAKPWSFVTKGQAEQLCAKSGKYLPTAGQWYEGALGTPDSEAICNISGSISNTGKKSDCKSGAGAFDMIGNVWEFVSGDVKDGIYTNEKLPETGYVASIYSNGLPQTSSSTPQAIYNSDYFWVKNTGNFVMMRGGFYGSHSDGGIYGTHADIDSNFANGAVGFRCAKNL